MDNTFDIIEKYIDEHIGEILFDILKEYLSKFTKVEDILIGDTVTWATCEFSDYKPIDNNEHMWYDTFKWNWTKFENGVIKIDERRV